ncbi:MAG: FAD-dependent oxidoreductase [Gammaproteobacteria bacterium]|nr:FAD-dependent oxidoreductase [Gammaproteobacteria bacterium]MBU0787456.1 FAD-dependent oxidoreductase [Gammaproteobacteria bacterium]MBU0815074.1 FAD-dependent oxidoreductase [Gammaproteobacteria bacterium]MBU1785818.1 FAD-dependent oxidoreductase [Gammaproteobacteria bacterium]
MIRLTELKLPLEHAPDALPHLIAQTLGITTEAITGFSVYKRSFDARKADLLQVYIVDVELAPELEAILLEKFAGHLHIKPSPDLIYHPVAQAPASLKERPVVVGFGPCGIFAALLLAQMGFKPLVIERGKQVRERTKDTWGLWRKQVLKPESNVQFGEGGAGTFSDGKLYSQIKDPRLLGRKVMNEFVQAGAPEDILVEAHPHIGTFKLVKVVEHMREQIIALGGEIRFQQRVTDVQIDDTPAGRQLTGLTVLDLNTDTAYELPATHVVMALGHSSRDTFARLYERGVEMHAKPFSIGFRIEHPQSLIDRARWGRHAGNSLLGAADYKLVHHAKNGRAVYSFCMCPGGTVVAATSEPGRVVTNGMSQYSRNERNANAGIVVGIEPPDFPDGRPENLADWQAAFGVEAGTRYAQEAAKLTALQPPQTHPLAGIVLQRQLESQAYVLGGGTYEAPGQLVGDFIADRPSTDFGSVQPSYKPGVKLGSLSPALPAYAIEAIREALPAFGKKIKGFDMRDAVLTGVETRTSSPLRIPRGEDLQSLNVRGLYPAGEGAGYAGGILSAGVDGIKVAEALALDVLA